MKCPKCGGKSYVTDTAQNTETNETYRRRKCRECQHVFYTAEAEVRRDKDFIDAWIRYRSGKGGSA